VKKEKWVIVTPALAAANNGNWQTAQRWARLLGRDYQVQLTDAWRADDASLAGAAGLIALHARRSAPSVHAWRAAHPHRPLVVVMTGTDLYRDIATDASAQQSMAMADRLVVLNELGLQQLPEALRHKAQVLLQSCGARQPQQKTQRHLRAVMVGHLRDEKSPETYFAAARLLAHRPDIHLDHIGAGLDADLAEQAQALMREQPRYRWLGALPHAATRARISAAHAVVHTSRMEGGAHVLTEAITSGTPVLASRIDGNVGLLGGGYSGLFDWGDAPALAQLLVQARDGATLLPLLQAQCQARAPLFTPALEQQALVQLLQSASQAARANTA
jgi:putative glycosyltransferase (TIGR04348 family)